MRVKPFSAWHGFVLGMSCLWSASSQTWVQTSAPDANWHAVTSSADGSRLVALTTGGPIFYSSDFGATWSPAVAPSRNWFAVASSAGGTRLIATTQEPAYISTNGGATWTQASNAPPFTYYLSPVTSSSDGQQLLIAFYDGVHHGGGMARSSNAGQTWTSGGPAAVSIAASTDGTHLIAGQGPGPSGFFGTYDISSDGGASWTNTTVPCSLVWGATASSADGRKLVVMSTDGSGYVYTSSDTGLTWQTNNGPSGSWISVASSADGARLVAAQGGCFNPGGAACGGPVYTSTDGGVTWTSNNVPAAFAVASSADGGQLVAVVSGGGIWIAQSTLPPRLRITPAGNTVRLSWLVPSTEFVLQESQDLSGTNWTSILTLPTLNLTNLENEVSAPLSSKPRFYRLKH
jgi:hypothetical protein